MVLHDHCGGDASVLLCRVCVCFDIVPDLCITTCDLVGSSGSMLGVSHWSHPLMFGARVQLLSSLCAKMKYFTGIPFLHPISKTWQYKSQIRSLKDPVQKIRPGP